MSELTAREWEQGRRQDRLLRDLAQLAMDLRAAAATIESAQRYVPTEPYRAVREALKAFRRVSGSQLEDLVFDLEDLRELETCDG